MSKLYDLLNAVISKVKNTEKAIPKKLSEIENDLFYSKPDVFLTLAKEDFVPRYLLDENGNPTEEIDGYYYRGSPKIDWLTGLDVFDFELSVVNPEAGENLIFTKANTEGWVYEAIGDTENPEFNVVFNNNGFPLKFINGYNIEKDAPDDVYDVCLNMTKEMMNIVNHLFINKVDAKKIPASVLDTGKIENDISEIGMLSNDAFNLADEAYSLANRPSQIIADAIMKEDGKYQVTINGFTPKKGSIITVIPDKIPNFYETSNRLYLSVNNSGYKEIRIYSVTDITKPLSEFNYRPNQYGNSVYFFPNRPSTLQYDGSYWIITNVHCLTEAELNRAGPIFMGTTGSTEAANIGTHTLKGGVLCFIRFINGWVMTPPKIKANGVEYNIIDTNMNVLQDISIPEGGVCLFAYTGNEFMKIV